MNSTIILIGSGLAAFALPTLVYFFFGSMFKRGKKRTNAQVNKTSALLLAGVLLGIPLVWVVCVLVVGGFSYLPPMGHVLLWGSIGVLAVLVTAFAGVRKLVISMGAK